MKNILRNPAGFLFILVSMLAQACSGNKNAGEITAGTIITADLEANIGKGNIVDLSSIVSKIEYIPLETSETSLVDDVYEIYFENEMFYLGNRNMVKGCQVFDIRGNHLSFFDRTGRGPEEYPRANHADVLPGTGNIVIMGSATDVKVYDPYGKFLNKFQIPTDSRFDVRPVIFINDSTYAGVIYTSFRENSEYVAVLFTPGDTIFKFHFPIPSFQTEDPFVTDFHLSIPKSTDNKFYKPIGASTVMYRYKDQARLFFPYNDTIFSVNADKKIETPYVIKFGKTRNPGGAETMANMNKSATMTIPLENDDFLFLNFGLNDLAHEPYEKEIMLRSGRVHRYKVTNCYALLNKKTAHFTLLNQPEKGMPGLREDIQNGPPFWPKYISSTGELVSFCTSEELIGWAENHKVSPKLKKIIEKLDENDNPVVILAKQ
ncbi:MAG: 6-bladed beta-propeller [Bacteroidales bacterium]|nr:6-bladed beta-propeller [Bacteroidales bacterium]MDD2424807.1 6-bladed beta-propeller [Bacteroidales bacterium]MDD3989952.1 6-bladed beta-propeller [Bacteroidales bacterium]MDD4638651.1 6-bladed beta-propeller [Bacteroidales bacterium]